MARRPPGHDTVRRGMLAAAAGMPLLGAAALLHARAASAREAAPLPAPGGPLALADVPLLDGGTFRAAQAEGKVLVLYWWASWCPFCAEMTPSIQKLWDTHRTRGLQVLGLSIDRRAEDARQHMLRRGYTFPSGMSASGAERGLPLPGGVPVTVVRGRNGRVAMAERGQLFPEDIEQIARFL